MANFLTAVSYFLKDAIAVLAFLAVRKYIFVNELRLGKFRVAAFVSALAANAFGGILWLIPLSAEYEPLTDFVSTILFIVSLSVFVRDSKLSKNVWTVLFIAATVDMLYSLVLQYTGSVLYIECLFKIVIYGLIAVFVYFVGQKMQANFLPEVFSEIPHWIYAVIMLFDLSCYYKEFVEDYDKILYVIIYTAASVSVIFCILFLVFKIFYMAHQQNDILRQLAIQKEFGEKTILGDEELRRFRHDYRNHMIVVNAYLERGRVDEAREYLNSLGDRINGVINKIKTGNFVSDAILNSKAVWAARSETTLSFSGSIPSEGIESEDLCTVLSNLVDNAVEAAEKVPDERFVDIEARCVNEYLILTVSNSTLNTDASKLKTTKKDKQNHGLGLKNVDRALKKYNGAMGVDCKNGVFTVDVRLELQK